MSCSVFIKKVLYVGVFALIINNFQSLSQVVFDSFSTLGIDATNSGFTAADLLRPGKIAGIGFQAAWPLLQQAGSLMGFTTFFSHVVTILVLLFAWVVVILSFFILAVQLFITIIEFKLTTLAGFVLVPFALWNKTAFLAERVLGNVIASGIKVMVLAIIIGIGATFFNQFIAALQGHDPSLSDAMSLMLASLTLFGLGIFGPGIASGLVGGAPQLGAGAAIGTVGGLAASTLLAGGAAYGVVTRRCGRTCCNPRSSQCVTAPARCGEHQRSPTDTDSREQSYFAEWHTRLGAAHAEQPENAQSRRIRWPSHQRRRPAWPRRKSRSRWRRRLDAIPTHAPKIWADTGTRDALSESRTDLG